MTVTTDPQQFIEQAFVGVISAFVIFEVLRAIDIKIEVLGI
jgi:hypothetical protein